MGFEGEVGDEGGGRMTNNFKPKPHDREMKHLTGVRIVMGMVIYWGNGVKELGWI